MNRVLDWYALSKEAAPGVLLGAEAAGKLVERGAAFPSSHLAELMMGFDLDAGVRVDATPAVALVEEGQANELFAWLQTYSAESFPISQYCRVETAGDWCAMMLADQRRRPVDSAAWASLIAGEMMANGDAAVEPRAVPLSWAGACFSFAMARAVRFAPGSDDRWTRRAAERLRVLEGEPRFVRRRVTVDKLTPMWALLNSGVRPEGSLAAIVSVALSALSGSLADLLLHDPDLTSPSAEQRIRGFEEVAGRIVAVSADRPGERGVAAAIAAAALLAGGSTSHIDLLRPFAAAFPEVLPWFGLLAGLSGAASWDSDWLRLVKGVERQVRGRFDLTDPVQGDLCWLEFDWIRQVGNAPGLFAQLPKHHVRLLSVEVAPGATCQCRLGSPPVASSEGEDARRSPGVNPASGVLQFGPSSLSEAQFAAVRNARFVEELAQLSSRFSSVVRSLGEALSRGPTQAPLFGEGAAVTKPAKPRRGRKPKAKTV